MVFRKKVVVEDKVEARFQKVVDLIRGLDKKEFNRLQEGMSLAWKAYQKVGKAKSAAEKEVGDIELLERIIEEK